MSYVLSFNSPKGESPKIYQGHNWRDQPATPQCLRLVESFHYKSDGQPE